MTRLPAAGTGPGTALTRGMSWALSTCLPSTPSGPGPTRRSGMRSGTCSRRGKPAAARLPRRPGPVTSPGPGTTPSGRRAAKRRRRSMTWTGRHSR